MRRPAAVGAGGRVRPARSRGLRRSAALAIALLLQRPAGAEAACRVVPRATVALERAGPAMLVPVAINGVTADFLLDTGAERTVVGLAAADRLRIARDEWVSTDVEGAGGPDRRRLGRPASVVLGGVALRRRTVAADNSVVVGPIPEVVGGRTVAGLLGQDFLSPFDLDLDLVSNTLTLFDVAGCTGRFLPWPVPYQAVAAWRPVRNVLAVPVRVNGTAMHALFDTGALSSVISLPGTIQLGLPAGGGDVVVGFGAGGVPARRQRFQLGVGDLPPAPAELVVAPLRTLRSIGALLGADWLSGRHVWLSWATDQVFVATMPTPAAR